MDHNQAKLLTELSVCMIGVLRDQYVTNKLHEEAGCELIDELSSINEQLLGHMARITVRAAAVEKSVEVPEAAMPQMEEAAKKAILITAEEMMSKLREREIEGNSRHLEVSAESG